MALQPASAEAVEAAAGMAPPALAVTDARLTKGWGGSWQIVKGEWRIATGCALVKAPRKPKNHIWFGCLSADLHLQCAIGNDLDAQS